MSRTLKNPSAKRLNLTLSPKERERAERLQSELDLNNLSDVFHVGVKLLEVINEIKAEGGDICAVDSDGGVTKVKLVL